MSAIVQYETYALCSQLIATFYRGVDTGDNAAAALAFGEGGTWLRLGEVLTGANSVKAALDQRTPDRKSCHAASNLIIKVVSDETLEISYYVTVSVQEPGEQAKVAAILDCHDTVEIVNDQARFVSKRGGILIHFA